MTTVSWILLQIAPVAFAIFVDNTSISGMSDIDVMKVVYSKFLSGVLNIGSASEMFLYSLSIN